MPTTSSRREFLLKRPLLQALEASDGVPPVLLIDEIDRADEEFEAFLLEILSDFQVTIPEIGTVRADQPPRVILTSNRTREVHDALKRRCLYHWIDYPDAGREYEIVLARVPDTPERLATAIVAFVQRLRTGELTKVPGVAETIDWAAALLALGAGRLTEDIVDDTLGVVLKYEEDVRAIRGATAAAYLEGDGGRSRLDAVTQSPKPVAGVSGGAFFWNALLFTRALRAQGITTDIGAAIDYSRALTLVDIGDREQVRAAGLAIFVRRRDEVAVYDEVFARFWQRYELAIDPLAPELRLETGMADHEEGSEIGAGDEEGRGRGRGRRQRDDPMTPMPMARHSMTRRPAHSPGASASACCTSPSSA